MKKNIPVIIAAISIIVFIVCAFLLFGKHSPENKRSPIIHQDYYFRTDDYAKYNQYVTENKDLLSDQFIHVNTLNDIGDFKRFEHIYNPVPTYIYDLSTEVGNLRFYIMHDRGYEEDIDKGKTFLHRDLLGEDMRSLTQKKKGHIKRNGLYYSYDSDGKLGCIAWIINGTYMEWQAGSLEGTVLSGLLSLDDEEFQESVAVLTEAFGFVPSETPTPTTP